MNNAKRILSLIVILSIIFIAGCNNNEEEVKEDTNMGYIEISQEEAKRIMDEEEGFVIVDVREQDEYDEGHIKGAILMPYESTQKLAPSLLKDKEQLILVYCRSGRRSKIAAKSLAEMGYVNVREFGGIITWEYGTVTD